MAKTGRMTVRPDWSRLSMILLAKSTGLAEDDSPPAVLSWLQTALVQRALPSGQGIRNHQGREGEP